MRNLSLKILVIVLFFGTFDSVAVHGKSTDYNSEKTNDEILNEVLILKNLGASNEEIINHFKKNGITVANIGISYIGAEGKEIKNMPVRSNFFINYTDPSCISKKR